jgi:hypothetical protein
VPGLAEACGASQADLLNAGDSETAESLYLKEFRLSGSLQFQAGHWRTIVRDMFLFFGRRPHRFQHETFLFSLSKICLFVLHRCGTLLVRSVMDFSWNWTSNPPN